MLFLVTSKQKSTLTMFMRASNSEPSSLRDKQMQRDRGHSDNNSRTVMEDGNVKSGRMCGDLGKECSQARPTYLSGTIART